MVSVYLDTNVFIRAFEARLSIAEPVRRLFSALDMIPKACVTSELTVAELFAPVKRPGALSVPERMQLYETLLARPFLDLVPVSRGILRQTAFLRQTLSQKPPDAIHVVTAIEANCRYLMSSDNDTKRVPPGIERLRPDEAGVSTVLKMLRG